MLFMCLCTFKGVIEEHFELYFLLLTSHFKGNYILHNYTIFWVQALY